MVVCCRGLGEQCDEIAALLLVAAYLAGAFGKALGGSLLLWLVDRIDIDGCVIGSERVGLGSVKVACYLV